MSGLQPLKNRIHRTPPVLTQWSGTHILKLKEKSLEEYEIINIVKSQSPESKIVAQLCIEVESTQGVSSDINTFAVHVWYNPLIKSSLFYSSHQIKTKSLPAPRFQKNHDFLNNRRDVDEVRSLQRLWIIWIWRVKRGFSLST